MVLGISKSEIPNNSLGSVRQDKSGRGDLPNSYPT